MSAYIQTSFTELLSQAAADMLDLVKAGRVVALVDQQGLVRYALASHVPALLRSGYRLASIREIEADLLGWVGGQQ